MIELENTSFWEKSPLGVVADHIFTLLLCSFDIWHLLLL